MSKEIPEEVVAYIAWIQDRPVEPSLEVVWLAACSWQREQDAKVADMHADQRTLISDLSGFGQACFSMACSQIAKLIRGQK